MPLLVQVTYECDPFMDTPWKNLSRVCDMWAVSDDIPDSFAAWTAQVSHGCCVRVHGCCVCVHGCCVCVQG